MIWTSFWGDDRKIIPRVGLINHHRQKVQKQIAIRKAEDGDTVIPVQFKIILGLAIWTNLYFSKLFIFRNEFLHPA